MSLRPESLQPLVSVITVCRNAADQLERALQEVRSQTYPHKEHIIIDGGSSDGTREVLERNEAFIGRWVSEPDEGIYDAMNKGLQAAGGEWIYFLGVDDAFRGPDLLTAVFGGPPIPEDVGLLLGDVQYAGGRRFRNRFGRGLYLKNTVHHQGAFYRRSVLGDFRFGLVDGSGRTIALQISGDYQLNLLLYRRGVQAMVLGCQVASCGDGVSLQGRFAGYREEIRIRRDQVGWLPSLGFDAFTVLRYVYKRLRMSARRR